MVDGVARVQARGPLCSSHQRTSQAQGKGWNIVEKRKGRIVETATEARQAEPGPSIFLVLIVSVVLAVTILGAIWFVFFKT